MSSNPNLPTSAADRRAGILSLAGTRERTPATLPGPDGPIAVVVRELFGIEQQNFEFAVAQSSPTALGMLLQLSIEDPESQELLFAPADREALQQLGMIGLGPILKLIQGKSAITDEDIARAKTLLANGQSSASS